MDHGRERHDMTDDPSDILARTTFVITLLACLGFALAVFVFVL